MKTPHFKQVAIIGVGLIGGSLGMILRRQQLADSVSASVAALENKQNGGGSRCHRSVRVRSRGKASEGQFLSC